VAALVTEKKKPHACHASGVLVGKGKKKGGGGGDFDFCAGGRGVTAEGSTHLCRLDLEERGRRETCVIGRSEFVKGAVCHT